MSLAWYRVEIAFRCKNVLWKSEILMSKMKMKMRKWVSKVVEMVKTKVELYCYYHHILVFMFFFYLYT